MLKGGKSGPALVPGDPEKSLLIRAVQQTTALKMPMGTRLNDQQIEDLVEHLMRARVGAVDLVDDDNGLEAMAEGLS